MSTNEYEVGDIVRLIDMDGLDSSDEIECVCVSQLAGQLTHLTCDILVIRKVDTFSYVGIDSDSTEWRLNDQLIAEKVGEMTYSPGDVVVLRDRHPRSTYPYGLIDCNRHLRIYGIRFKGYRAVYDDIPEEDLDNCRRWSIADDMIEGLAVTDEHEDRGSMHVEEDESPRGVTETGEDGASRVLRVVDNLCWEEE